MATQITNYQCLACTGPLHYAADSGKLECEYCGTAFTVEELEAFYGEKDAKAAEAKAEAEKKAESEKDWMAASGQNDWGADGVGMKAYNCPSCAAELICDESTAASSCPYCGNPNVVPGQFAGALKPDYIIPFKVKKEAAIEALKNHYKGKFLLPKAFSKENQLNKIQGVYVPFWLFNGNVVGEIKYEASSTRVYERGDYEITETKHYDIEREGSAAFERVPVDASTKMPDDYMDSIEPFDYEGLKPFSNAYLPGFLADKFDVSVEDSCQRVDERFKNSFKTAMLTTVSGYDKVDMISSNIEVERGQVQYALLPVWLLSTKWHRKNYLFAVNGQTGKIVGDLPMDKGRYWGLFAAVTAAVGTIVSLAAYFLA